MLFFAETCSRFHSITLSRVISSFLDTYILNLKYIIYLQLS